MTAIASSITATTIDRITALFIVSLISSVMYHADRSEEKRYSQAEAVLNGKVTEPSLREAPAYGRRHHTTSSERSEQQRAAYPPAKGGWDQGSTLGTGFFAYKNKKALCISRDFLFQLTHLAALLNYPICPRQHSGRNRETDLLGCLEIDHQLKFRGLLDRQVSGLGTFEDFVNVGGGTPVTLSFIG